MQGVVQGDFMTRLKNLQIVSAYLNHKNKNKNKNKSVQGEMKKKPLFKDNIL